MALNSGIAGKMSPGLVLFPRWRFSPPSRDTAASLTLPTLLLPNIKIVKQSPCTSRTKGAAMSTMAGVRAKAPGMIYIYAVVRTGMIWQV